MIRKIAVAGAAATLSLVLVGAADNRPGVPNTGRRGCTCEARDVSKEGPGVIVSKRIDALDHPLLTIRTDAGHQYTVRVTQDAWDAACMNDPWPPLRVPRR